MASLEEEVLGGRIMCDLQEGSGPAVGSQRREGAAGSVVLLLLAALLLLAGFPGAGAAEGGSTAAVSESLMGEIQMFEAMAATDPRNATLRFTLGMLYQLAGRPREVCDNLHMAYVEEPGAVPPELLFHLANNLKAIGENNAAVDFYALAIGGIPQGPVNWVLISITLDFIGKSQEAVRGFQTVLRLGPPPRIVSWVEIYMLSTLAKVGQQRRAVWRYGNLVGHTPPPQQQHAQLASRPPPISGHVLDTKTGAVLSIDLVARRVVSHPSFVHAARAHTEAWARAPLWGGGGDAQVLTGMIQELQAPRGGCAKARVLIIELGRADGRTGKVGKEIHGFGLGAQMHVLSVALSYALSTGRTLVTRDVDNWWYTDAEACPSRAFTCYFEPLSTCTEAEVIQGLRAERGWSGEVRRLSKGTEGDRVVVTDCRLDNFLNEFEHRQYVPQQFAALGLLWWRSRLVAYILRPNRPTLAVLESDRQALGWGVGTRVTGVHVRHGDKKTESSVVPMELYMQTALEIAQGLSPGAREHVTYISSDDAEAVEIARHFAASVGAEGRGGGAMRVIARDDEVRGVSTATDQVVKMHNVNATRYGLEAISNLYLLSHCDAFVGTMSSNFGRLAFELAHARFAGNVFGASMDVFWHAYP